MNNTWKDIKKKKSVFGVIKELLQENIKKIVITIEIISAICLTYMVSALLAMKLDPTEHYDISSPILWMLCLPILLTLLYLIVCEFIKIFWKIYFYFDFNIHQPIEKTDLMSYPVKNKVDCVYFLTLYRIKIGKVINKNEYFYYTYSKEIEKLINEFPDENDYKMSEEFKNFLNEYCKKYSYNLDDDYYFVKYNDEKRYKYLLEALTD